MRVLELYSGIGGMHYALKESGINYEVVTSIDINTSANEAYRHNFPNTINISRNIQSIKFKEIKKLSIDCILMSPPCQPFTRVGLKKDISDERTNSLLHIINIIPQLITLKYILVENVKGFEVSQARNELVECIDKSGFCYKEFILSPCQFGIPNTRHRYYLLAKKKNDHDSFDLFSDSSLVDNLPEELVEMRKDSEGIKDILENDINEIDYLIPDKVLSKYSAVLDVQTPSSKRSCCFTKAYSHYAEGTGSVFSPFSNEIVNQRFEESKSYNDDVNRKVEILKSLKLRYFTPREVSRLMCFPESFKFPKNFTRKQKYRLLGNSINVYVVSQLILLLTCEDIADL